MDTATTSEDDLRADADDRPRPRSRRQVLVWAFPAAILLAVAVLGAFEIHGSSVGIYRTLTGGDVAADDTIGGPVRPTRSDEWYVRTPWVARQYVDDLPTDNTDGVGSHDVAIIADVPTGDWDVLIRPHTLPYRLLDFDSAFATEWWLLHAVQLLGLFALLVVLTSRPALAIGAAVLVTFSPASQWWTINGTFTTLGYGCLAAAAILAGYRARDQRRRLVLSVAGGWAIAAFLAALYVPWQIGTAFVLVPVVVGVVLGDLLDADLRRNALRALAVVVGVSLAVGVVLFGAFLLTHREAVETIAATVYPGERSTEQGGGVSLVTMWGGSLDSFSADPQVATVNGTNQSENAAGIVYLLPVAIASFGLAAAGRLAPTRLTFGLLGTLVGGGLLLSWMLLPIPGWLGRLVVLDRVPPFRLHLPLLLCSVLALVLLVDYLSRSVDHRVPPVVYAVSVGGFAAVQLWAAEAYRVDGLPIGLTKATLIIALVTAALALMFSSRMWVGLVVLAGFTLWQANLINPIARGTAPLTDNELRTTIIALADDAEPDAGWVVVGPDAFVRGIVTSSGVNTLSSVSPYPDDDAWRVLDPSSANEDVWNRYALVVFEVGGPDTEPAFTLQQPDLFTVTLDPCDAALDELGVDFFVTRDLPLDRCVREVEQLFFGGSVVFIYERVPTTVG